MSRRASFNMLKWSNSRRLLYGYFLFLLSILQLFKLSLFAKNLN